ncbi:MAG: tetratricopeptide repeat protein [Myxococcota bacterium]
MICRNFAAALVAAALGCCALALSAVASPPPDYVLGPGQEARIRALLEAGGPLDGRLEFQEAKVEVDRIRVRYAAPGEGGRVLEATLVHPSDGVGHFAVAVSGTSQDDVALVALRARVAAADFDPWTRAGGAIAAPGGGGVDEITVAARREITEALRAWHVGEEASARKRLDDLRGSASRIGGARLELAEAYWRIGDGAVGRSEAAIGRAEADGRGDAVGKVRGDVLGGADLTVAAVTDVLRAFDALCEAGPVADAYSAVGAQAKGLALLEQAAADPRCDRALIALTDWLIDASRFEEALRVSEPLMARSPDTADVRARRARALMALGRPQEAAETLEPVAWASADSGLISSLLGAYNRVPDAAWQKAKREELLKRAEADPDDHIAAFLAGVLLHYEGQFERSDAMLRPLLPIFGKQPRLFIYLGMNAFNLERRDEALALIEQAMTLEAPDPDVYYCRAEIFRWTDPALALADLDRYLAEERGSATQNEKKTQRVVRMRELLAACVERGAPIPCAGPWEHPRGHEANRDPAPAAPGDEAAPAEASAVPWKWLGAGGALALGLLAAWTVARRRRADGPS